MAWACTHFRVVVESLKETVTITKEVNPIFPTPYLGIVNSQVHASCSPQCSLTPGLMDVVQGKNRQPDLTL